MDVRRIQPLLAAHGLPESGVGVIPGGWASWTFDVAGEYILRIARTDEIARCHRKEARLLPALAREVGFEVPVPKWTGTFHGHEYMLYPRLAGRGIRVGDNLASLSDCLRQLHDFDLRTAAGLVDTEASPRVWRKRYEQTWSWVDAMIVPVLDDETAQQVRQRYTAMLASIERMTPTFVHADLGAEHVLVNGDGEVTAIIDFETATIGDPAIDFVGVLAAFGHRATAQVIAGYGAPIAWERLHFYWWMGSVHAIKYGIDSDDRAIVADGIAGLQRRLREIERWSSAAA